MRLSNALPARQRRIAQLLCGLSLGISALACAQSPPVCSSNRYGSAANAQAIEIAMQSGDAAAVRAAILAARSTRGAELGCAESAYSYASNTQQQAPTRAAIESAFALHRNAAAQAGVESDRCPALGRGWGAFALGGWWARSAGLGFELDALRRIADNLVDTQYVAAQSPGVQAIWPGLYGYAESLGQSGHPCFVPGVVGEGVATACDSVPALCVVYQRGRHAGQRFAVGDYAPAAGVRDGGAGFDQGWAGVMMVEAAIGETDPARREVYRRSALAAGEWALSEPPVRNHNYTAKLVWLLASLYDWTGDTRYRDGMIDKLERNLLPGVLMDLDGNGEVDGLPGRRFADLVAPAARIPGRMWDGHNALPWYQAMNAWALVEAYLAFRSRGDAEWAARVRPYALASMDNLAAELAPRGGLSTAGPGLTQVAYAMAVGLYKLADPEGLARPQWEGTLWAIWNAGLATAPGDNKTATAALVSLRATGQPYRSLRERVVLTASRPPLDGRVSGAWYDPASSGEGLFLLMPAPGRLLFTWYTYDPFDPSRQAWIGADGAFDGRVFEAEAVITRGTRFGAGFDPAQVQRIPWGRVRLEFSDCARAQLQWQSTQPGFASGQRAMQRLALTEGLPCLTVP